MKLLFQKNAGSIRTRIAAGFLLLLFMVFAVLGVSYNQVVNTYIRTQAERQLGIATENVNKHVLEPRQGMGMAPPNMQDMKGFDTIMQQINNIVRRATFFTQVQALVIGQDNEMVYPVAIKAEDIQPEIDPEMVDSEMDPALKETLDSFSNGDYDEKNAVYQAIQAYGAGIEDNEIHHLTYGSRTYYVVTQPLSVRGGRNGSDSEEQAQEAYQLVLYLDMTDVSMLARTLNQVLLSIILLTAVIAAVIAIVMSARITRPIRQLSTFAEAIGRNDFRRREMDTQDRELIELGDTMNRAAEQLESYDKEQKTFFQNVSHELRTPLMSIKGYAEGIKVGVFDDSEQAADVIMSETDHLAQMVEELLYLSRMDNITNADKCASLDIRELLSSCGESLRGVALHENKQIEYDFDEDPVDVLGSEKMLERAFVNVLSNGLRYAKKAVCIHCHVEGDRAVVRIEDDGAGIDEGDLPHIFDRFYKGKKGKHGIGLSIAKAVVLQHQGQIGANNTGHGAEFVIDLPICQEAE